MIKKEKKFKMISITYTYDCAKKPRCSFCYLKREQFVRSLIGKKEPFRLPLSLLLKNTEQIAIAYNGIWILDLKEILQIGKNNKVIINVTTNPEFLTPVILSMLRRYKIAMVALSLDPEKCNLDSWIKAAKLLREKRIKVGANILMLDEMFPRIAKILEKIKSYSYQIHLLRPKFYQTKIPMEKRRELIWLLKQKYKNLFIDECFKWEFTGEPCKRGEDFISINPDGTKSLCSFDIYRDNRRHLKKCPYI